MTPPQSPWRRSLLLAGLATTAITVQGAETLLERLLRISGLSAAPGQLRDGETAPGSIWVCEIGGAAPVRWTSSGGFRSPVFAASDGSVFALADQTLVRVPAARVAPLALQPLRGVAKLVGFDIGAPDELIMLMDDGAAPLAALSLVTGKLVTLPYDRRAPEQDLLLSQIRAQDRGRGDLRVLVRKQQRQGLSRTIEWTDIMVQQGPGEPRNLSRCDGINCSQPGLSPDGARVVFVKADA